jgi:pilus assembly protein Flp/PilA
MFGSLFIQKLLRDTRGATAIEYGLIASLIVIAMIAGMQTFASSVTTMWSNVDQNVSAQP